KIDPAAADPCDRVGAEFVAGERQNGVALQQAFHRPLATCGENAGSGGIADDVAEEDPGVAACGDGINIPVTTAAGDAGQAERVTVAITVTKVNCCCCAAVLVRQVADGDDA